MQVGFLSHPAVKTLQTLPRFGKDTLYNLDHDGTVSNSQKVDRSKKTQPLNRGYGEEQILPLLDDTDVLIGNTSQSIDLFTRIANKAYLQRLNGIVTRDGTGVFYKKDFKNNWIRDDHWESQLPKTYNFDIIKAGLQEIVNSVKKENSALFLKLPDAKIIFDANRPTFKIKINYGDNRNTISILEQYEILNSLLSKINNCLPNKGQTDYRINTYTTAENVPDDTIQVIPKNYNKARPLLHLLDYYTQYRKNLKYIFIAGDEKNDIDSFTISPPAYLQPFYAWLNTKNEQLYADILHARANTPRLKEGWHPIKRGFDAEHCLYVPKTDQPPPHGIIEAIKYFKEEYQK